MTLTGGLEQGNTAVRLPLLIPHLAAPCTRRSRSVPFGRCKVLHPWLSMMSNVTREQCTTRRGAHRGERSDKFICRSALCWSGIIRA